MPVSVNTRKENKHTLHCSSECGTTTVWGCTFTHSHYTLVTIRTVIPRCQKAVITHVSDECTKSEQNSNRRCGCTDTEAFSPKRQRHVDKRTSTKSTSYMTCRWANIRLRQLGLLLHRICTLSRLDFHLRVRSRCLASRCRPWLVWGHVSGAGSGSGCRGNAGATGQLSNTCRWTNSYTIRIQHTTQEKIQHGNSHNGPSWKKEDFQLSATKQLKFLKIYSAKKHKTV